MFRKNTSGEARVGAGQAKVFLKTFFIKKLAPRVICSISCNVCKFICPSPPHPITHFSHGLSLSTQGPKMSSKSSYWLQCLNNTQLQLLELFSYKNAAATLCCCVFQEMSVCLPVMILRARDSPQSSSYRHHGKFFWKIVSIQSIQSMSLFLILWRFIVAHWDDQDCSGWCLCQDNTYLSQLYIYIFSAR